MSVTNTFMSVQRNVDGPDADFRLNVGSKDTVLWVYGDQASGSLSLSMPHEFALKVGEALVAAACLALSTEPQEVA